MGLLSKATTNSSPPKPDDMGNALCTRLLSLNPDELRAETAMTLLKAYGSFQTGVCLSRHNGLYSSYASVAAGDAVVIFPQELLKVLPGKKYYSVDYVPPAHLAASLRFWAFPLTVSTDAFPTKILMVGEDQDFFQGENIAAVLEKTSKVFLPVNSDSDMTESEETEIVSRGGLLNLITQKFAESSSCGHSSSYEHDEAVEEKDAVLPDLPVLEEDIPPESPLEKAVMEILNSSHDKFGGFQGIVIDAIKYSAGEFIGRLNSMVSSFGTAQGLAPGRCLVLFGTALDSKLIARHLSKTVQGKAIFDFREDTPQRAFTILKPYL
jgi:hypothetical protein